jgi:hypothetical protein
MQNQYRINLTVHEDGAYWAVLIDYVHGACPQIPSIQPSVFHERLERELGFSRKASDKIVESINADPDHETEVPVSATNEQLRRIGFLGLD